VTHRHALTDAQWKLLSGVLPRRRGPAPTLGDRLFIDAVLYRLVQVFFHKLKRFRAAATRFEKTATNYLGVLHLACAAIWLRDLLGDA